MKITFVLIFAWNHYVDDPYGLEDVLNDFTEEGGYVIFIGYSSPGYGGMFPGSGSPRLVLI